MNGVPVEVRGQLQEGFLSLFDFSSVLLGPFLKSQGHRGPGQRGAALQGLSPRGNHCLLPRSPGLSASVVSAVSPGLCMGVAQCCGLVDGLLEDVTLPRVLLDVMGPRISSCFHIPWLCSSYLREMGVE